MKHKLPESLKIGLLDNQITNTDAILKALMYTNDYDMLEEYYNFLSKNIDIKIYKDLDIIIAAIKSRLNTLKEKKDIKQELEKAKNINKSLQGLVLIENLKEYNDTNKDVYYLKYSDEENVHILEITNLLKFSELLQTTAPTMNAHNFYEYLKSRYFKELRQHDLEENIDLNIYETEYHIKDKPAFLVEKDLINTYVHLNYPNMTPKLSIDSNHERIYYVGNTIIKFHNDNGKRKMEIISKDNTKEQNKALNTSDNKSSGYIDTSSDTIFRNDLDNIDINEVEVKPLIAKYISGTILEKEEKIKVYAYLLNILDSLELGFNPSNTDLDLLASTVDYLQTISLNSVEKEILFRATRYYKMQEDTYSKNNEVSLKKTYKANEALIPSDNGASLSIIIITVTILLGALISAIMLVK